MKSIKDTYLFLYQITHLNLGQWSVEQPHGANDAKYQALTLLVTLHFFTLYQQRISNILDHPLCPLLCACIPLLRNYPLALTLQLKANNNGL